MYYLQISLDFKAQFGIDPGRCDLRDLEGPKAAVRHDHLPVTQRIRRAAFIQQQRVGCEETVERDLFVEIGDQHAGLGKPLGLALEQVTPVLRGILRGRRVRDIQAVTLLAWAGRALGIQFQFFQEPIVDVTVGVGHQRGFQAQFLSLSKGIFRFLDLAAEHLCIGQMKQFGGRIA